MARDLFTTELGLKITDENSDTHITFTQGSAAPNADEPQGSLYSRTNGEIYIKLLSGSGADKWEKLALLDDVTGFRWRSEVAKVLTDDAYPGDGNTVTSFSDQEGANPTVDNAGFSIGDYIIFDGDGTPTLAEVTATTASNITVNTSGVNSISDNDVFTVTYYLPDSGGSQEGRAIVIKAAGGAMVKLADINWDFADGINLASGYAASSGDVTAADNVQTALQKIDGNVDAVNTLTGITQGGTHLGTFTGSTIPDNTTIKAALQAIETAYETTDGLVDDLITLSGVPANSTDLGTFTGTTISDSQTVKAALQDLETAYEETDQNVDDLITLSGMPENSTDLGTFTGDIITDNSTVKDALQDLETAIENNEGIEVETGVGSTATELDAVPIATYDMCWWEVYMEDESTSTNRRGGIILAMHDGTNVDTTKYAKLKLGSPSNVTVTSDISGGNMRLMVSVASGTATFRSRRLPL